MKRMMMLIYQPRRWLLIPRGMPMMMADNETKPTAKTMKKLARAVDELGSSQKEVDPHDQMNPFSQLMH